MDKLLTSYPKCAALSGRQSAPATSSVLPSLFSLAPCSRFCARRGRDASEKPCDAAVRESCNYRPNGNVCPGHEPLSYTISPPPPNSSGVLFCGLPCSGFSATLNIKIIYNTLMYLNKSPLPKSTSFKYPLQPNICCKLWNILFWCSLLLFTYNENLFHVKTLLCLNPLQNENSNLALLELTLLFGKQFSRQKGLQQHPFGIFSFAINTITFQIQIMSV